MAALLAARVEGVAASKLSCHVQMHANAKIAAIALKVMQAMPHHLDHHLPLRLRAMMSKRGSRLHVEAGIAPMTTSAVFSAQFPYYLRRALSP